MATFVFIMVLMIETFPFCFISELIADDCIDLTHAIFHSDWVSASKRYKATLAFFLHQTQQPIVFIAGGIFPICMRTNIEVRATKSSAPISMIAIPSYRWPSWHSQW